MRSILLSLLLLFAVGQVKAQCTAQQEVNLNIGIDNLWQYYYPTSSVLNNITVYSNQFAYFTDITYVDQNELTMKGLMEHLARTLDVAIYYRKFSPTPTVKDQLLKLLTFPELYLSLDTTFFCKGANWNNSALGVPESLNKIFAAVKGFTTIRITDFPELDAISFKPNQSVQDRCGQTQPIHEAGDELSWYMIKVLSHYNHDECSSLLTELSNVAQIIEEDFGTDEGLKSDYSFHDHSQQLYMCGYGFGGYLESALEIDQITSSLTERLLVNGSNAHYQITEYASQLLGHQFFDTKYDFNAMGRGVSEGGALDMKWSHRNVYLYLKQIDPTRSNFYQQILDGTNTASYHNHSWKSDYMIHRTDDYFFSVRMASSRVTRQERADVNVNQQNRFTSLGATNISLDKTQYEDFISSASMDWNKYPGTTSFNTSDLASIGIWGGDSNIPGNRNLSDFCGGVSHHNIGVSAYEVDDYLSGSAQNTNEFLKAKKAWFCFNDKIVCLGADIEWYNNSSATQCYTSVNQSNDNTPVQVRERNGGAISVIDNDFKSYRKSDEIEKVWQDQIGYQLLQNDYLYVEENYGGTSDAFKFYIRHVNQLDKYAYVIVPKISSTNFISSSYDNNLELLQNTGSIQAVFETNDDVLQAVFYEAGELTVSPTQSVKVDAPCVLMVEGWGSSQLSLSVSDPNQNLSCVQVEVIDNGWQEYASINLPQGEYKGRTITRNLNLNEDGTYDFLYPVADSYVLDGSANENSNYGTQNKLLVKNAGPGYNRETYLRFSLANIPVDFNGSVQLRLKERGVNNGTVETFGLYRVDNDNWTETGITNVNKPASESFPSAIGKTDNGNFLVFDVSALVKEEMQGDGVITLALKNVSPNSGFYDFHSKEFWKGSERPRLIFKDAGLEIPASGDAYVQSNDPNQNYEAIHPTELKIKSATGLTREIFLNFDWSSLIIPQGNKASLRMYCSVLTSPAEIGVYRVPQIGWGESTINWSNKPLSATHADSKMVNETGFVEWDISSLFFPAVAEGETELSLKLESLANNYQVFTSMQSAYPNLRPVILISSYPSISAVNETLIANKSTNLNSETVEPIDRLLVYPSPVVSTAQILGLQEGETWQLFNNSGQLIMQGESDQLDLEGISQGVYFLKGSSGRTVKIAK